MEEYHWDTQLDYLSNTRDSMHNDDYLAFLVKVVWKIDFPVRMIDFGCGYGYLGLQMLPHLPKGSTYTGLDAGTKLIDRAKEIFKRFPYETQFIIGDIWDAQLEREYDLAICQAFLLHISDPKAMLQQMVNCVVDGGRIVCIEPHWISHMASYHLQGTDQSKVIPLGVLQKLFESDANRTGKDGNIGMKLPVYMSQLGLNNIECRMSDRVNFLNPAAAPEKAQGEFESMLASGFAADPGEAEPFTRNLMDRGLSRDEARQQFESEHLLAKTFDPNCYLTHVPSMRFTYGTVERG